MGSEDKASVAVIGKFMFSFGAVGALFGASVEDLSFGHALSIPGEWSIAILGAVGLAIGLLLGLIVYVVQRIQARG